MLLGPIEAAHAYIEDDRHDMVEWGAAVQLKLKVDLSYQLRGCNIATTYPIRLGSANVLAEPEIISNQLFKMTDVAQLTDLEVVSWCVTWAAGGRRACAR